MPRTERGGTKIQFRSNTQVLPCLTSAHPFYNSADSTDL